jgi:hypothetical protein
MVRCPYCGQNTSGDYCHCCKYPILYNKPIKAGTSSNRTSRQAVLEAESKAKQEAEVARKAKEADKQAIRQAVLTAKINR